jgi:hypothetical protein
MSTLVAAFTLTIAAAGASEVAPIASLHDVVEHWPLTGRAPSVQVDALAARVVVTGKVAPTTSALCPVILPSPRPGTTVLRCRTSHIAARVVPPVRGRGGNVLELVRLKAAPVDDGEGSLPLISYDLKELGIDDPCPGTTPLGRGECALHNGDLDTASRELNDALRTPLSQMASLRLGDLAAARGDILRAVQLWDAAGPSGIFARLGAARLCEYTGDCLAPRPGGVGFDAFDGHGTTPTVHDELVLRKARIIAYGGDVHGAIDILVQGGGTPTPCRLAPALCRRLLVESFRRQSTPDQRAASLALYATLPERDAGPHAFELGMFAANEAADEGAPLFGARLLSWLTVRAPARDLETLLVRAAELFIVGGDRVRARAIYEWSCTRLPALHEKARWAAVKKKTERRDDDDATLTSSVGGKT